MLNNLFLPCRCQEAFNNNLAHLSTMVCKVCERSIQLAFDNPMTDQPHHACRSTLEHSVESGCMICVDLISVARK